MELYYAEIVAGIIFLVLVPTFLYFIHRSEKKRYGRNSK